MDARTLLRQQFGQAHTLLDTVVADVDATTMRKAIPGSKIADIATIYIHSVVAEDMLLNGLAFGRPTIFNADWSAKTGVPAFQMPSVEAMAGANLNVDGFREYARAVFAATDEALANLTDEQASRELDAFGQKMPVIQFVATIGVSHVIGHCGELSALKGVHGLKGLPF